MFDLPSFRCPNQPMCAIMNKQDIGQCKMSSSSYVDPNDEVPSMVQPGEEGGSFILEAI